MAQTNAIPPFVSHDNTKFTNDIRETSLITALLFSQFVLSSDMENSSHNECSIVNLHSTVHPCNWMMELR